MGVADHRHLHHCHRLGQLCQSFHCAFGGESPRGRCPQGHRRGEDPTHPAIPDRIFPGEYHCPPPCHRLYVCFATCLQSPGRPQTILHIPVTEKHGRLCDHLRAV